MTARQRDVLDYFEAYYREHGVPPTVRSAGQALGMSSVSTIHLHVRHLVEQGYLEPRPLRGVTAYFPVERIL